ncbi:hypothetical protein, partial [Yersinia bercovieri]|uniref:hypothetical protein n=1 Tax=Yersinia bercovieri TaxID=634 RepID=UPI001C95FD17
VRDSWVNIVARVVSIAGTTNGPIRGMGRYPYFDDARDSVYAEIYEVSKEGDVLVLTQVMPKFVACPSDSTLSVLSCPGSYAYSRVDLSKKALDIRRLIN